MHKLESELKIQKILKGSAPKMFALRGSSATSGLPGAWRCTGRSNEEMVDKFVHMGVIITSEVEDAFRAVPRGAFVPHDLQVEAYIDSPLRGEPHVHLSAPHMYATVLEALQLSPGLSFLNIGSGTGYFSCLAGYILQNHGINHGVELHEDLVRFAKERVEEYLQFCPAIAHDICMPKFVAGNCFRVDPSGCNYDRVYCGAACPPNKVPFILALTKIGGFAIIPCRNKLLKIERVSETGVKQTCISDVNFAPLVAMPDSDSSLPKLFFPKENPKRREKNIRIYPPSNVLVSRGKARTLLAKLRALQEATECLLMSQSLPVAFCYVPSQQQVQQYFSKKTKARKHSSVVVTSPVDQKISFFGSSSVASETDTTGPQSIWNHLQKDKLWQTVLEYYYSLCNVSYQKRCQTLDVYLRRKVRHKSERRESKKVLSYAEIAHKLGILSTTTQSVVSVQECRESLGDKSELPVEEVLSAVTGSASSCGSTKDCSATVDHSTNSTPADVTSSTFCSNSTERFVSRSDQAETFNQPNTSSNSQSPERCSQKLSGDNNVADEVSSIETCKTRSSSGSNGSKYTEVLIEMERELMERLATSPSSRWCLNDDLVLVHLLCDICEKSSQGRTKGWFSEEYALAELLSKASVASHPRLSNYSPESLAYRTIALCRIAQILDSVLYLVTGPSLLTEQSFCPNRYQLDSFTESSFMSSWLYLESRSSPPPINYRTEEKSVSEANEKFETKLDKEGNNFLHEGNLKKAKHSLASLEKVQEQLKAVKRKICFIEEQKQLLHSSIREQELVPADLLVDMDVGDVKVQRNELLLKQQKQEHYKLHLLALLKKLKEDEKLLTKKVECLTEVTKQETAEPPQQSSSAQERKAMPQQVEAAHKWTIHSAGTPLNDNSSARYSLSSLLPKIRFLLPLCSQRWRLVHELLHTTELSAPDYMPVITVDRRVPLVERHAELRSSVFLQVHRELKGEKLHFRWNKCKYDQWWEVKFVGEGIIDQGGGFRDSLAELADELCPLDENVPEILPYLIRTPNQKGKVGDILDCFIPNPGCDELHMFHWLGVLMGGAFRSDESLTLAFPPFVWKLLVGEHVTWAKDYAAIDEAAVRITDELEALDEELYKSNYGDECTFSTVLSDGRRVELLPAGEGRVVMPGERKEYASLVRRARMTEFTKQVQAMRQGLMTVVPESVLTLLTWCNLERGVCGDRDVTLAHLKAACKYGDDLRESSKTVKHMWTVLSQFSSDERSRFLRFVTGRKRPPAPFTVAKAGGDKDSLPHASTCASTLFLPDYSSAAIAKEKLSYAISNCVAIDTDTSPW